MVGITIYIILLILIYCIRKRYFTLKSMVIIRSKHKKFEQTRKDGSLLLMIGSNISPFTLTSSMVNKIVHIEKYISDGITNSALMVSLFLLLIVLFVLDAFVTSIICIKLMKRNCPRLKKSLGINRSSKNAYIISAVWSVLLIIVYILLVNSYI